MNRALLSSVNQTWATPKKEFKVWDRLLRFTLDACAVAATAKCRRFVGPEMGGLNVSWDGERVFCNYPYDEAESWMPKARNESLDGSCLSANLIALRPDTEWYATGVLSEDGKSGRLLDSYYDALERVWWLRWQKLLTGVHSIRGRITFEGKTKDGKPNNAPFPSALVIHATPGLQPKLREGITRMWPRW